MAFYHQLGKIPKVKHTTFFKDDGKSLYREELVSSLGFSGPYSNLYHFYEPSRVLRSAEIPPFESPEQIAWKNAPLQYYHFYTDDRKTNGNFISGRHLYMHNAACAISFAMVTEDTDCFFRNAYHHEVIFIHRGTGRFLSEYGELAFGYGDQIVVPKGAIYQLKFDDYANTKIMITESTTPFNIPRHYRNDYGQLEEHAPYCERDLRRPENLQTHEKMGEYKIIFKAGERFFEYVWDHHPFDVVGWDGFHYPFVFNMKDFQPKVGKIHLPPPVHLVFTTESFVYCNFCPRLFDFHEQAIPAPYYHYNVDSDEVLYYVEGDFMSRAGVKAGSVTLHPTGLTHGPQPGKTEASVGKKDTYEYAVMVDTFAPLQVTQNVKACLDPHYNQSWLPKK